MELINFEAGSILGEVLVTHSEKGPGEGDYVGIEEMEKLAIKNMKAVKSVKEGRP